LLVTYNASFVRKVGEFGYGLHLQLGHEMGAVRFDGALAGVNVEGDLFVQPATEHMGRQ
jgi:hypothetical protein